MPGSMAQAFAHNFLGHSPRWYKASIVGFLILNAVAVSGPRLRRVRTQPMPLAKLRSSAPLGK